MTTSILAPSDGAAATYGEDIAFLREHTEVIELSDEAGQARLALAPGWQGRVMTSAAAGDQSRSFGWINRELISSGQRSPHMNAFGGEDRFWMGPEGGQFSIFFAKGAPFDLDHWYVPAVFDTEPYHVANQAKDRAAFTAAFTLTNYSGTVFHVGVQREVRLLDSAAAWKNLGVPAVPGVQMVAYESQNRISNLGQNAWNKATGLLSIWILGMFTPSPNSTICVPIHPGPDSKLGPPATSDYFGPIPAERFKVTTDHVFLSGDGHYRSKIGINPKRSKQVLGAYDADHQVLTIVQFTQPKGVTDYVNSLWKIQAHPYAGDVANSYNDGAPSPGAKPLGPFFEMESSSPAAALAPSASLTHVHRTLHLAGPEASLDTVCRAVLGLPLAQIKSVWE